MIEFSVQATIWGSLLGASVLLAALAYLQTMPDAPSGAAYWTVGFALWVVRLAVYLVGGLLDPALVTFLSEVLQATSALLIMVGTLHFRGRQLPAQFLPYAIGGLTLWVALTTFIVDDFLLRSIPLYIVSGGALMVAGITILRGHAREALVPAQLVGVALVLWGLHKLDYPWLRPVEWFAPFGFLLSLLLGMCAAVGLLLLTAGRLRSLAAEAQQKHAQSREHLATLNELLQISLGNKPLHAQLDQALEVVIAAPWLALEPRGGIFLVEDGQLKLTVHSNLAPALHTMCAQVAFGRCLCGRAAQSQTIVHAAHVEGKREGIDEPLVELLAGCSPLPVTYAGGIRDLEDLELMKDRGRGRVDFTVGSALDIFGGDLAYHDVVAWHRHNAREKGASDEKH
jgi:putative methionine-R-sulfoxide reductase with GAF domain